MWSLAGCFDASGSFVQCACQLPMLHLGMCVLEELHFFERLVVVCFIGVEKQLSAPQVPWLRLRQPRVLRRKRDCTLPSSSQLPRELQRRRCVRRRRKDCTLPSSSQRRHVPRRKRERPSSSQNRRVPRRRRNRSSSSQCGFVLRRRRDRPSSSQCR